MGLAWVDMDKEKVVGKVEEKKNFHSLLATVWFLGRNFVGTGIDFSELAPCFISVDCGSGCLVSVS